MMTFLDHDDFSYVGLIYLSDLKSVPTLIKITSTHLFIFVLVEEHLFV